MKSKTNFIIRRLFTFVFRPEESIPAEFYSLFMNQTYLLQGIFNYTTIIPNLEFLIQGILNSSSQLKQAQEQQNINTTQNCTNAQVIQQSYVAPACPLGIQAPGKYGYRSN